MKRLLIALLALGAATGCTREAGGGAITVKGSDTMVILGQQWAEHYMKINPGTVVQVTGGGSGTGIAALINGGTDICESSRPMKAKEKEEIRKLRGKEAVEIPVALDGLAIYVNDRNPIRSITMDQVKGIYTGKISNWKELGGEDARIVAYSRDNSSGTYAFFKEHVLANGDFAADVQTLTGTAAIINAVGKDLRSIGYGGIGYAAGLKTLPVQKDAASPAVEPTLANVQAGTYPLSRELYFYTVGAPEGKVRTFIDWALSEEGQAICEKVGYYPLRIK